MTTEVTHLWPQWLGIEWISPVYIECHMVYIACTDTWYIMVYTWHIRAILYISFIYGCYAKGPCKRFIQNDLSSQEPILR